MQVVCLDLEGVLVPEIWIHTARRFNLPKLALTTRDIPDYDELMRHRLKILKEEDIRLPDIQKVIAKMRPLPGAKAFLKKLRASSQIIILSDTFYQFAAPLMRQLDRPTLFCHDLIVSRAGVIQGYKLRQRESKRKAVMNLKKMRFQVKAAGDAYNDIPMLRAADQGILFRPPSSIRKQYPQFPVASNYASLTRLLSRSLA